MSAIEIVEDTFTCRQEEEIAIFKILEGANILSTTVRGKDVLSEALDTVKETKGIKGVAFLYSEKYQGKVEHEKFMKEILENIQHLDDRRYSAIFKHAIIHYLEQIYTFPKPIVGGMDGDIVPPSFATNLALDMQIATDKASFILPDLKFGLPPSPPLAFYLIQNLGPRKAAELIFTKSELTAQEALDLGLITQVVSKRKLKETCIDKLRQMTAISADALIESRRMLKPSLNVMRDYIDKGFEGIVRCLYKMKKST